MLAPQAPPLNAILATLVERDLARLQPYLQDVPLALRDVLHEPGESVVDVYFPSTGVISIVAPMQDGRVVEVATVGREGMVGLPLFLGAAASSERAVVQVAGQAQRMRAADFCREADIIDGPLQAVLRRYTHTMFTQLARNGACNRVHPVRQRAARWLLTTADRMPEPTFGLTQEFLAQLLSVRRASVSHVAKSLAADGSIRYTRGTITILDRARLQASACECYAVIRGALDSRAAPS